MEVGDGSDVLGAFTGHKPYREGEAVFGGGVLSQGHIVVEGVDIRANVRNLEGEGLIIIVDFHLALKFYLHPHLRDPQMVNMQGLAIPAPNISSHQ